MPIYHHVLAKNLHRALKANISSRLFADSTLDILSSADAISKLEPKVSGITNKSTNGIYILQMQGQAFL